MKQMTLIADKDFGLWKKDQAFEMEENRARLFIRKGLAHAKDEKDKPKPTSPSD